MADRMPTTATTYYGSPEDNAYQVLLDRLNKNSLKRIDPEVPDVTELHVPTRVARMPKKTDRKARRKLADKHLAKYRSKQSG